MAFVAVRIFSQTAEAHFAKAKLDSEEIYNHLRDELSAQTSYVPNTLGGIKLEVREEDYHKADEILEKLGYIRGESKEFSPIESFLENPENRRILIRIITVSSTIIAIIIVLLILA